MVEAELAEIESRAQHYPAQARHDILRLARELRRLYATGEKGSSIPSPLYDQPTGLLNTGAYGVRFAMARARATRFRKIFAVLSVELELPAGVQAEFLVSEIAGRLERCLRATDTLARTGERGFSIILEDLTQTDHAQRVKQNVENAILQPVGIGDHDIVPRAQVSLQFFPDVHHHGPVVYNA